MVNNLINCYLCCTTEKSRLVERPNNVAAGTLLPGAGMKVALHSFTGKLSLEEVVHCGVPMSI